MEGTRTNRVMRIAEMHANARTIAGKSQEYMAMELGVSKKTVQNWERGISVPDLYQSIEWFRVLNINPFRDFMSVMNPSEFEGLKGTSSDEEIDEAFRKLADLISISDKRAIMYIFYGKHGSDPHAFLQLVLAHLHTSLTARTSQATIIANMFELEKELDHLVCTDNIMPDMNRLNNAIKRARLAVVNNEQGYSVVEE